MTRAVIFHTSTGTVNSMKELAAKIMPDIDVKHIVEESMINDVRAADGVTPAIAARIGDYIHAAEKSGAIAFMTACSSIGNAVEQYRPMSSIPLFRIDQAMVEEAVRIGGKITVLATVATTLRPTLDLVQRTINAAGSQATVASNVMPSAFDAFLAGDRATHDKTVRAGLEKALEDSSVVILAQASMASVVETLSEKPRVPVLTSPESGMKAFYELIKSLEK
jgi:Asp/Glu/hydantoin racemase